ncbi:MAG: 4Fe-4S dicluster domain-containing protein [Anaerolineae bacterium]|nr:4Fe-4S dicluster domain-containing protein [Anaerolineae bacterium]
MAEEHSNGHKWTMIVDVDKCTGCQACVVACHAENNVPVSSEDEVIRGRANHWIRIERYWEGEYPNVKARFLPVFCQQCGNAPCEPVCPVYASYHSTEENINIQVYNRCIGTRYCGNNCPYRARLFNFWAPRFDAPLEQQLNPDVTVRSPGVMEKCTFCIQRIRRGREQANIEGRPLEDGEIVPACAQACPTDALIFGDKWDENSRVAQMVPSERQFKLLENLGTEPAVYYLKGGETHVGE